MEPATEREIGRLFGLMGGVLLLGGGLFAAAFGATDLALGRVAGAIGYLGSSVALFVVGSLVLFFAYLADHEGASRPFALGVALIVLALVGGVALGAGANLPALVGGIFVLLAGALYLIEPVQRAASAIVASGG